VYVNESAPLNPIFAEYVTVPDESTDTAPPVGCVTNTIDAGSSVPSVSTSFASTFIVISWPAATVAPESFAAIGTALSNANSSIPVVPSSLA
jgi:hypothetical protein